MKGVDLSDGAKKDRQSNSRAAALTASGSGRIATGPAGATPSGCSVVDSLRSKMPLTLSSVSSSGFGENAGSREG